MQEQEAKIYIADLLWVMASGKVLDKEIPPYSKIISQYNEKKIEDNKSGVEIVNDVLQRLDGGVKM